MVAPLDGKTATAAKVVLPHISSELLDQIVTGPMTQQGIEEVMQGLIFLLRHSPVRGHLSLVSRTNPVFQTYRRCLCAQRYRHLQSLLDDGSGPILNWVIMSHANPNQHRPSH